MGLIHVRWWPPFIQASCRIFFADWVAALIVLSEIISPMYLGSPTLGRLERKTGRHSLPRRSRPRGALMSHKSRPTIQELRVRPVRVPMTEPHQTASGTVAESPLVLTDVSPDAGIR